ncbi:MAG: hypothetical protein IJ668_08045 [Selenomonadaceae bacterium]|nr:hypothetical protein [Selenomonadaceae bacterium]
MNNEIYVGGNAFNQTEKILSGINRKLNRINGALNIRSYDELLQSLKARVDGEKSKADMTLDEYKQYIVDIIQSMPTVATHWLDSETIVISDKGYEAMKADPEYEAWVLDTIRENLSTPTYANLVTPKLEHVAVHSFGASKEEYRGQSWSHQTKSPMETTESWWTTRRKRSKHILELEQEMFDNVQTLKALSNRKAMAKAAAAKAAGLDDSLKPEPVIVGIPAEFLLGMLDISNVKL